MGKIKVLIIIIFLFNFFIQADGVVANNKKTKVESNSYLSIEASSNNGTVSDNKKFDGLVGKLKQNAHYRGEYGYRAKRGKWGFGIKVFGRKRMEIKEKLEKVGISSKIMKTKIYTNKIRLYCSNITEDEIQMLLGYLEIDIKMKIDRRSEFGGRCAGGNNGMAIHYLP